MAKTKLTHMLLNKADFTGITTLDPSVEPGSVKIVRAKADLDIVSQWIKKVGGDSNWHKRKEQEQDNLKTRINETSTRLWLLQKDNENIGFGISCETINLNSHFNQQSGFTEQPETAVHFYKFGLLPENRHNGLGAFYGSSVVNEILKEHEKVYLNTRDSNTVQSIHFWEKVGFKIIEENEIDNDVISNE